MSVLTASLMMKLPCSLDAVPASVTTAISGGSALSPQVATLRLLGARQVAAPQQNMSADPATPATTQSHVYNNMYGICNSEQQPSDSKLPTCYGGKLQTETVSAC
jgi:hypothetical protein